MFQFCLDREIQSGSIGTGLAARYHFSKHFEQLLFSESRYFLPYKRGFSCAPCQNRSISTTFAV
jgi:hypothetical protein